MGNGNKATWDKLHQWEKEKKELNLSISPNPKDPSAPIVTFGEVKLYLHCGWKPPINSNRTVIINATQKGSLYLIPVAPDTLPKGEFEENKVVFFRETLHKNSKTGRYFFRLRSGTFLVLSDLPLWLNAGIEDYLGATIELIGVARPTCFVVEPKFGYDKLGYTETIRDTVNDQKIAQQFEEKRGLIRIMASRPIFDENNNVKEVVEEEVTVPAVSILGIDFNIKLSQSAVERAARPLLGQYHPDMRSTEDGGVTGTIKIDRASKEVNSTRMYQYVQDAKRVLLDMMNEWDGKSYTQVISEKEGEATVAPVEGNGTSEYSSASPINDSTWVAKPTYLPTNEPTTAPAPEATTAEELTEKVADMAIKASINVAPLTAPADAPPAIKPGRKDKRAKKSRN